MAKKRMGAQGKNCPSCGAPIVSEICAYCGTATGLNTAEASMEYPVLECREATMNFWTLWFPMIFAAAFGIPGLIIMAISFMGHGMRMMFVIGLPFALIGAVALWLTLRTVMRHAKVKKHGTVIQATVYGYMDDNVLLNDRPAQIVKLLVQTKNGPRFILYQLGSTVKLYGVQDKIRVLVYENYFLIDRNRDTVLW